MFLLKNVNNLAYVAVEVENIQERFTFVGIFAGIKKLDIDVNSLLSNVTKTDYLFLFNEKLYIINSKSYIIKSISVGNKTSDGSVSNLTYSLSSTSSIESLTEIYEECKKLGKVLENGLIDISKFTEPKEFIKNRLKKYNSLVYRKDVKEQRSTNTCDKTNQGTSLTADVAAQTVKKPTTTVFSRNSKYDVAKAMKVINLKFKKLKQSNSKTADANIIQQTA